MTSLSGVSGPVVIDRGAARQTMPERLVLAVPIAPGVGHVLHPAVVAARGSVGATFAGKSGPGQVRRFAAHQRERRSQVSRPLRDRPLLSPRVRAPKSKPSILTQVLAGLGCIFSSLCDNACIDVSRRWGVLPNVWTKRRRVQKAHKPAAGRALAVLRRLADPD